MQIDPKSGGTAFLVTEGGGELKLPAGREVVARVVSRNDDGTARISLAGQTIDVSDPGESLSVNQTVRLVVSGSDGGSVRLTPIPDEDAVPAQPVPTDALGTGSGRAASTTGTATTASTASSTPVDDPAETSAAQGRGAQLAAVDLPLPDVVGRALARTQIPVSDTLVRTVAAAVQQAMDTGVTSPTAAATGSLAEQVSTACAELSARGIQLSPQVIQRVVTALASRPDAVFSSLQNPTAPVDAEAAAAQSDADPALVVSRLVTAEEAPAQVDARQLGALVRGLAAPGLAPESTALSRIAQALQDPTTPAPMLQLVELQSDAATRDSSASVTTAAASQRQPPATGAATTAPAQAAAAAEATGSPIELAPPAVATAVARLIGHLADAASRARPGEVPAQPAALAPGSSSSIVTTLSHANSAIEGDAAVARQLTALVDAARVLEQAPASQQPQAFQQAQQALTALRQAPPEQLARVLEKLPLNNVLQLAGHALELGRAVQAALDGAASRSLQSAVHDALRQIGTSLDRSATVGTLAQQVMDALGHASSRDGAASTAASHALHAFEGTGILSVPKHGADPGAVYFNVPVPGWQTAQVRVRRDTSSRSVNFETFDIAFLLDTEHLGTLMIHLQAEPGSLRANVTTDRPDAQPIIEAAVDALREPMEQQARRPLSVAVGLFDSDPPTTLMDNPAGPVPGASTYYA